MTVPSPILTYCHSVYAQKDSMHGIDHIKRLIQKTKEYIDLNDTLEISIWLHGLIETHEPQIRNLLTLHNLPVETIIRIARDSLKNEHPTTWEGAWIHDIHLLEGNDDFLFIKSVLTGYARGQTLTETIDYYKRYLYRKNKCALSQNQKILEKREERAYELFQAVSFLAECPCPDLENTLIFTIKAFMETHNEKPALLHSIRVCRRLFEKGYPLPILQAAMMHDIVEDTQTSLHDIQREFGCFQENLIRLMTVSNTGDYEADYRRNMAAMKDNMDALIIRCADLIDNYPYIYPKENNPVLEKQRYFYKTFEPILHQEAIWHDLKKNMNPFGHLPSPWIKQYETQIKTKKTALDIGCAHGGRSYQLAEMGLSVTAIDKELPNVRAHSGIRFIESDIRNFNFERYDIVLAINVLQFLDKTSQQIVLENIITSLNSDGFLFIESFTDKDYSFGHTSISGHFKQDELKEWALQNKLRIVEYHEDCMTDNHFPIGTHIHGIVTLVAQKRKR